MRGTAGGPEGTQEPEALGRAGDGLRSLLWVEQKELGPALPSPVHSPETDPNPADTLKDGRGSTETAPDGQCLWARCIHRVRVTMPSTHRAIVWGINMFLHLNML